MIPQTPRHDFLHELHKLLQPATYLEIGVQTGRSLQQAGPRTYSVGVDPAPVVQVPIVGPNIIYPVTSDAFFAGPRAARHAPYDLAFIDGMHLVEYCLRDFMGVERLARPDGRTVAVFDDVLPYSVEIARRQQPPGDWAGDCWKVFPLLDAFRPDLTLVLVDVAPTGALVALDLKPGAPDLHALYSGIVVDWAYEFGPLETGRALDSARRHAVSPAAALGTIRNHLNITEA